MYFIKVFLKSFRSTIYVATVQEVYLKVKVCNKDLLLNGAKVA